MPNFGKDRRPPVTMDRLNAMPAQRSGRRSGRSADAIEAGLDAMAARNQKR
jgi:cytochrome c5